MPDDFVFGFGSLVARAAERGPLSRRAGPNGYLADLPGFRRTWGVAMDNAVDLPAYKYYVQSGPARHRPAVFVGFLDLAAAGQHAVNGVVEPADAAELARLDTRERNYTRVDVTDRLADPPGTVWAYVGLAESRLRADKARDRGLLVVQRDYAEAVKRAFRALGAAELAKYEETTEDPAGLLADLTVVLTD